MSVRRPSITLAPALVLLVASAALASEPTAIPATEDETSTWEDSLDRRIDNARLSYQSIIRSVCAKIEIAKHLVAVTGARSAALGFEHGRLNGIVGAGVVATLGGGVAARIGAAARREQEGSEPAEDEHVRDGFRHWSYRPGKREEKRRLIN